MAAKIISATPTIKVADIQHNTAQIITLMKKAHNQNACLLSLPALCITGATCGDLFASLLLLQQSIAALHELEQVSAQYPQLTTIVGLPMASSKMQHGKILSVAAILQNGKILGVAHIDDIMHASLVENFDQVYNKYKKLQSFTILPWKPKNAHENVSESGSIFVRLNEFPGKSIMEHVTVALSGANNFEGGAMICIHMHTMPEILGAMEARRQFAISNSKMHSNTHVIVTPGMGESTTDLVFSGHNIIASHGEILQEAQPFCSGWAVADIEYEHYNANIFKLNALEQALDMQIAQYDAVATTDSECEKAPSIPQMQATVQEPQYVKFPYIDECKDPNHALTIQAAGLAARMSHIGTTKAVIGISGGLDSTLALLVTVRAYKMLDLPLSDIIAITMPCFGTTTHTKSNAHALCVALGVPCKEIDIKSSVTQHLNEIGHPSQKFDITFENAQARMRTMVLMNVANQENGIVIGTGSMSEAVLGWATFNGDHMSMYSVNAGVPKTLTRHIVKHMAQASNCLATKKVLESILATKVSPELLPAQDDTITQVTEDVVGPYELHDFFIYHALQHMRSPQIVLANAAGVWHDKYSTDEIRKWLRVFYTRFFSQQFKRNCMPDAPQVVGFSLSPRTGFKMPSDAAAVLWLVDL